MSSYFPILPNIILSSHNLCIEASTLILNISSNHNLSSETINRRTPQHLATYALQGDFWKLLFTEECHYGDFIRIKRSSLNVAPDQMVVSLFRNKNDFPNTTRILPEPQSQRIDRSPVAERASLEYSLEHAMTSYQGEYPLRMTNMSKGSFWSFDALSQNDSSSTLSFIILMNLNRSAANNYNIPLHVSSSPKEPTNSIKINAKLNSFSIIKKGKFDEGQYPTLDSEEIQFITSKDSTFIPMYLNIDLDTRHLSLEHTHPPSEMFWGFDKYSVVRQLKRVWLR